MRLNISVIPPKHQILEEILREFKGKSYDLDVYAGQITVMAIWNHEE